MYDAIVIGARCAGAATAMLLARRGLDVLETGCPRVTQFTSDFGDFELTGRELEIEGIPMGLGPRRSVLDAILVEAAVEAGAELREGTPVRELTFDGDRVTGIEGERARIVIGADGRNSGVAK